MASFVLRWAWLIPVAPLLAFAAISLGSRRRPLRGHAPAFAGIVIALVLSQVLVWVTVAASGNHTAVSLAGPGVMRHLPNPPALVMMGTVPLISLSILIFGIAHLRGEARARHFYAHLSLVTGALTAAILVGNLLAFFLIWQLISAGAYLFTRLWWKDGMPRRTALKSFIVGRVADAFLLLGLALLYGYAGSLAYADVFSAATVARLAATPFLGPLSVATVAILLLVGGVILRSVERPLHVWLLDVAEGADTLFALIDTATMVPAGVYLLLLAFPLLEGSRAMPGVALVGVLLAISAALASFVQSDLKRILALSTIGQLGFMLAALGAGAYVVALSLLIVHGVAKTLLVMTAASVVDGVERGHVHSHGHAVPLSVLRAPLDPTDMFKLGGLAFRMPLTALLFLAGSLALCGVPLVTAAVGSANPTGSRTGGHAVLLVLAAGLTALYLARQVALIFLATPRSRAAIYARDSRPVMMVPMGVLALTAVSSVAWVARLTSNGVAPFAESSRGPVWPPAIVAAILSGAAWVGAWWLYGRQPLRMRGDVAVDPVFEAVAALGASAVVRGILRYAQAVWGRLRCVAGACSAAWGLVMRRMESGHLSDRLTSAFVGILLLIALMFLLRRV
jgi:NADH-quinone oxidoreductase subunit L